MKKNYLNANQFSLLALILLIQVNIACTTTENQQEADDFSMYGDTLDDLGEDGDDFTLEGVESIDDPGTDGFAYEDEDQTSLEQGSSIENIDELATIDQDANDDYQEMLDSKPTVENSAMDVVTDPTPQTISSASQTRSNASKVIRYKIRPGDTLRTISKKFYGTPKYSKSLMQYNRIKNHHFILMNRYLKVPAKF